MGFLASEQAGYRDRRGARGRRRAQRLARLAETRKRPNNRGAADANRGQHRTGEKVISTASTRSGADATIAPRGDLRELDVDWLDLVELAQMIEDECGVELNGDAVKDVKTVGEVDRPGRRAAG